MQTLTHGQTHGANGVHMIVSAETTLTRNSKIYVWRHIASKCSCNSKHKHGKWYWPIEIVIQLITQGITTLATQWTRNNIQPDRQQGHASLNHDSVVGDQADKIESLEHLIHALISSKDKREDPGL